MRESFMCRSLAARTESLLPPKVSAHQAFSATTQLLLVMELLTQRGGLPKLFKRQSNPILLRLTNKNLLQTRKREEGKVFK